MELNCTLDGFRIPGFSGFLPAFGTKEADDTPVTPEAEARNAAFYFLLEMPIAVTEDSTTSEIQSHRAFEFLTSGITLTLGDAAFTGCHITIANSSTGTANVAAQGNIFMVDAGAVLHLDYIAGHWRQDQ